MVAKITVPGSVQRALNYNEQKVKEGVAKCIYAHLFLKDAGKLRFSEKLGRLEGLVSLNKRARTNTLHISLNFAEREILDEEKLSQVAIAYMQKIGFGEQPYLVYQHHDAGHPHIHIVTTTIQKDGKRISIHNLGRNESSRARKEIEIAYGLVKAEEQNKDTSQSLNPLDVQRIVYGKSPTKRAITNVLDVVLSQYKYSSIAQLNAVLRLYNVYADTGERDSSIFRNKGLLYRVLTKDGNKTGVPIKASSIYNQPTLRFLEKKFKENELSKEIHKKYIKSIIDWTLLRDHQSIDSFQKSLEKEKVTLVIRQNDAGIIYGLTYIDHRNKCVFNGSDLGKEYSAKAILGKCSHKEPSLSQKTSPPRQTCSLNTMEEVTAKRNEENENPVPSMAEITLPIEQRDDVPYPIRKRKKKKKKNV